MTSIPIDIVNHICKFAAGKDKVWYPFFSLKTSKVSWKVNPYCSKMHELAWEILVFIQFFPLTFHNYKTGEERVVQCRMVESMKLNHNHNKHKLYIEFDLDDDINSSYMIRGMLSVSNYRFKNDTLYLNGTPYADVKWGCVNFNLWTDLSSIYDQMVIEYETY